MIYLSLQELLVIQCTPREFKHEGSLNYHKVKFITLKRDQILTHLYFKIIMVFSQENLYLVDNGNETFNLHYFIIFG